MQKIAGKIILLSAVIVLGACSELLGELRVYGSSTMFPLVQSAALPFEEQSGIHIDLQGGGSEKGIQALLENLAEVSMVSRELSSSDPGGVTSHTIGYDGIALIVNRAVLLDEITDNQVVDIYTGKILNWSQLTGSNQPVSIISKHDGHGTKTMFDLFFNLTGRITPNAFLFHSNNESIAMVSSDPHAIGYVSIGSAEHAIGLGLKMKILRLNGIEATSETVASGKYPLRRALNLVTRENPGTEAARFVEFMLSPVGQKFVKMHHFVVLSGVTP